MAIDNFTIWLGGCGRNASLQITNLAKDVVRNNFPYLHRRIWAHSVVARRLFSQLHGASCA